MKTMNSMISVALLVIIILMNKNVNAQSYVYKNCSSASENCIYTINDEYIYKGNSTMSYKCVFTFDGTYVYKGASTISYDCLYTISGGYIYKGSSTSNTCIYNVRDGRVYKGSSSSSIDCIYTISGNSIYKGHSTTSYDCVACFSGNPNFSMLALLIINYFENQNTTTVTYNEVTEKKEFGKATGTLEVGSLVAIKWYDGKYWFARIESFKGEEFYCLTGDNQFASVDKKDMIAITEKTDYKVGDIVLATWKDMRFYSGSIDKIEKDGAIVKWDDGSDPILVKFNMMYQKD